MKASKNGTIQTSFLAPIQVYREKSVNRRRIISPEAGRALEVLGHAIDYLIDEYVHCEEVFSMRDPKLEAVELLSKLNREIYFACPIRPTLKDRWKYAWTFGPRLLKERGRNQV